MMNILINNFANHGNGQLGLVPFNLVSLYLKSWILIGFMLNPSHVSPALEAAFRASFHSALRPLFQVGIIVLVLSFGEFLPQRHGKRFHLGLNAAVSLLFLCDTWYLRSFSSLPSWTVLGQYANLPEVWRVAFALARPVDFLYAIDLVGLLLLWSLGLEPFRPHEPQGRRCAGMLLGPLLLLPTGVALGAFVVKAREARHLVNGFNATETAEALSPLGFHLQNLYACASQFRRLVLTSAQRADIAQWFQDNREPVGPSPFTRRFKGMNLLVIQVESLEQFVLNQRVNGQEVTPTLNRLLHHSLYFSRIHEQVNGGMSCDADLMTNTSIFPVRQGSTFWRFPVTSYPSLPKAFAQAGYSTLAMHADPGALWNWKLSLSNIGFEQTLDASAFDGTESFGMGLADGSYLRQVKPLLLKQKQPFYSFVVTLSSHTPFKLPAAYRTLQLDPALDRNPMGGYLESIHYTDHHLGLLLDGLEQEGLLKHTLVAIYGDHTGVHKYHAADVAAFPAQQAWWNPGGLFIPLLLYHPELEPQELTMHGGQIDIMPTLMDLMGLEGRGVGCQPMGRNLLASRQDLAVLTSGAVLGRPANAAQAAHLRKGLAIADLIIRGNYFQK